jgi:hypothetical protein
LQSLSAGRVGCSPAEITIAGTQSETGSTTWIATCGGVEYQCARNTLATSGATFSGHGVGSFVGTTQDVSCAPRPKAGPHEEAKPGLRAPTPADAATAAAQVERLRDGDRWMLRTRLAERPFVIQFEGVPNRDGTVEWGWELPAGDPQATHASCEAVLLIDGQRRTLRARTHARNGEREVVRFMVNLSLLTELSASKRAAGRLCDDEWHLTDPSRWVLAEYVARYGEEANWKGEKRTPPACCTTHTLPCACSDL